MSIDFTPFYNSRRYSLIPNDAPDKNAFPLFYNAKKITVFLNEGEMLFIPKGWFHFVSSLSPNSVTGMNIAFSNWCNDNSTCDCSYDLHRDYSKECTVYYDDTVTDSIYQSHSTNSSPFKIITSLHTKTPLSNMDYPRLCKYFNNAPLRVFTSIDNYFASPNIKHLDPEHSTSEQMTFPEFYAHAKSGKHCYLGQQRVHNLPILPFISTYLPEQYLWINFGNATTNLHYDNKDNVLLQLQGKRKITLFPPSEREHLYLCNPIPPKELCDFFGIHDS